MVQLLALENRRVACLDGWRGLAILSVLVGHFTPASWFAAFGVELFFVLSGRLLAEVLVFREQELGTFALRRASRILPALFVCVGAMTLLGAWSHVPQERLAISAAAALLFFSNYLPAGGVVSVLEHSWSLAVEEHSYMVLAAVVFLARRDAGRSARIALALSTLLMVIALSRSLFGDEGWRLYLRTESRAPSILLSFAVAVYAPTVVKRMPRAVLAWAAPATLASSAMLVVLMAPLHIFHVVGTLLLVLSVNLVEHGHPFLTRTLDGRILRWFGLVSFSLYLWQQPFYTAQVGGLGLLLAIPAVLLLALASYHLVEAPGRRLIGSAGRGGLSATGFTIGKARALQ